MYCMKKTNAISSRIQNRRGSLHVIRRRRLHASNSSRNRVIICCFLLIAAILGAVVTLIGLVFDIKEKGIVVQQSWWQRLSLVLHSVDFSKKLPTFAYGRTNNDRRVDQNPISSSPYFSYFGSSQVVILNETYVPLGGGRFTEWKDGDSPYEITDSVREKSDDLARQRRQAVKNAMVHAWGGYKKYAFGYDELQPVSGTGKKNWFGIGTTLVDALDTLWLMDMKDDFYEARDWVRDDLSHDIDHLMSTFENTIRSLGGLLSAYAWSGDDAFLEQAKDLGNRLIYAFDSPSGVPYSQVNLRTGTATNYNWAPQETQIACAGSLQLEFRQLTKVTGNETYAKHAEEALDAILSLKPQDGLFPSSIRISDSKATFGKTGSRITFGGLADSFYEYLLKLWLQGGMVETKYRDAYDQAIEGLHKELLHYSSPSRLAYLAKKNMPGGTLIHEFEHLECFMGGILALGAHTDPLGPNSERAKRDMRTAKAITYTCYQMYAQTKTGLGAEIIDHLLPKKVTLRGTKKELGKTYDFQPKGSASQYLLRPEVVESLFILNRITGDPIYREWGWEIFLSIENFCKTKYGYGAFPNVQDPSRQPNDSMESFFLGETLKYLYLLFDPDSTVSLSSYVFNTEAHPLPIFS